MSHSGAQLHYKIEQGYYDVAALANKLSHAFNYRSYGNNNDKWRVQENLNQEETSGVTEFSNTNFWRVDQQVTVLE